MQELEHPIAIYWDSQGNKHTIRAEELYNSATLELAKRVDLRDPSGQVSLSPRIVENKRPHFKAPADSIVRRVLGFEKNPIHDQRIDFLLSELDVPEQNWKLTESYYADRELVTNELFKVSDYSWGKEIHRFVSVGAVARHDLFGQSQQIEMSIFRPWIAIEVINTHYPDEETFEALVELTRMFPFIVLFDCTDRKNYFLKVDSDSRTITTRLYLRGGSIWSHGKPIATQSSAGLEIFAKSEIARLRKADAWRKQQAARA